MDIEIDHDSTTPPFEQLRVRILELVRNEELVAGAKIPTVRKLASDLGIAPNTVARTYRELEQLGVIETRGRLGSFIAASGDPTRTKAQQAATEYVAAIRRMGISDTDAAAFVATALRGA
ncbi:GntR family transcriptional regulator [Rhodococcus sp. TAF43]|uniref:GntR family transcriptional regulator n=1 Tax=unclassified Rhodococcus (in: high G+C Gram-positive bacteria) TaxID=192944 RepID=UPI000E0B5752|nr:MULTISPECIES: GntR family transcriptional regulator [unclassified Rhodococcus (in: high G+C Gram-positive bacteria)]QKT10549.1 GntR family transcriptional regulator [Rhodococcus sp. W8901]RDI35688.1 GntR family transcriptional regulator [Rhodococcus sp. AG1013]